MAGPEDEKPIVSLLVDDPVERPRIEAFVLGLSDSVDSLQDLEHGGDFHRIEESARALAAQAKGFGFPPLFFAAQDVGAAAALRDAKRTREAIVEFTDVARRVRLGHRGAALPG
jgi:hypothetical protein